MPSLPSLVCNDHYGYAAAKLDQVRDLGGSYLPPEEIALRSADVSSQLSVAYEQHTANLLSYLDHAEGDEYERVHSVIKRRLGMA